MDSIRKAITGSLNVVKRALLFYAFPIFLLLDCVDEMNRLMKG